MGEWSATSSASEIISADWSRQEIVIRHTGGSSVWLGFGDAAVEGEGVRLSSDLPVVVIDDERSVLSVSAVCASGEEASGLWIGSVVAASGVTYQTLMSEVGAYLGYGSDSAGWNESHVIEMDRYIQAGIRQFYRPPAVQGVEPGYEWTFLRPSGTITTVAGTYIYDLPREFSRLVGDMYYDPVVHQGSIVQVGQGQLLAAYQNNDIQHPPRIVATRIKDVGVMLQPQDHEAMLWPVPDAAYVLTFQYEAYTGRIDAVRRFPLGGDKYGETIISSCLAVAEMRANDSRGIHWENFASQLASAIKFDISVGAMHYGYMGDTSGASSGFSRRNMGSFYPVSYKGDTW